MNNKLFIFKNAYFSMFSKQSGALLSIEVWINGSLRRLADLYGEDKEAHYEEYKEWLDVCDNNAIKDDVLYCNYLG
tara:strand:+ start:887 stop:1114 length:228 start_codon:yes stop_codon:yes gene_type:complete